MSEIALRVDGVSKRYKLGESRPACGTLRDSLARLVTGSLRKFRRATSAVPGTDSCRDGDLWALKDVSFAVERGEVLGVIGHNGAGKSTLLKILAGITEPTAGTADLHGRVGSLLEVGTGFHPELTGRENIFLNGAILGMSRREIQSKFDDIVAFAENEGFLDTPVKFYSSGMAVRLAFAVAAHLEPEILLVDEVLAVGDAAFQKKCLDKMGEVVRGERAILFVSHNMTNVAQLCDRVLLLDSGRVSSIGTAHEVVESYLRRVSGGVPARWWLADDAPGDDLIRLRGVYLADDDLRPEGSFALTSEIRLVMEYSVAQPSARLNPVFLVRTLTGLDVFSTSNYEDRDWGDRLHPAGYFRAICRVPQHILNDGSYAVDVLVVQDARFIRAEQRHAVMFTVHDRGETRGGYTGEWRGVVRPRCGWSTEGIDAPSK